MGDAPDPERMRKKTSFLAEEAVFEAETFSEPKEGCNPGSNEERGADRDLVNSTES